MKLHNITKHPSPLLFFGSVGVVFVHFFSDFVYDVITGAELLTVFSRCMIVLAASFPVVGGATARFDPLTSSPGIRIATGPRRSL